MCLEQSVHAFDSCLTGGRSKGFPHLLERARLLKCISFCGCTEPKQSTPVVWSLVAHLSLRVLVPSSEKAWGKSSHSAHPAHPFMPTVPGRWCFPRPPAARPQIVPSVACDSSFTWPPSTHTHTCAHTAPVLCRPVFPENTPQQAWNTCHVASLSSITPRPPPPSWLSLRHNYAHNLTWRHITAIKVR